MTCWFLKHNVLLRFPELFTLQQKHKSACLNSACLTAATYSIFSATSRIHVFSSCIQQGANNLLTLPSLYFLLFFPFASIHCLDPPLLSYSFSKSASLYSSHGEGKPKKLSEYVPRQSPVSEMPSGSALDIGLGVSLTRNKPIKESPGTA